MSVLRRIETEEDWLSLPEGTEWQFPDGLSGDVIRFEKGNPKPELPVHIVSFPRFGNLRNAPNGLYEGNHGQWQKEGRSIIRITHPGANPAAVLSDHGPYRWIAPLRGWPSEIPEKQVHYCAGSKHCDGGKPESALWEKVTCKDCLEGRLMTEATPKPKARFRKTFCWKVRLTTTNAVANTARIGDEYIDVENGEVYVLADDLAGVAAIFSGDSHLKLAALVGPAVVPEVT